MILVDIAIAAAESIFEPYCKRLIDHLETDDWSNDDDAKEKWN